MSHGSATVACFCTILYALTVSQGFVKTRTNGSVLNGSVLTTGFVLTVSLVLVPCYWYGSCKTSTTRTNCTSQHHQHHHN